MGEEDTQNTQNQNPNPDPEKAAQDQAALDQVKKDDFEAAFDQAEAVPPAELSPADDPANYKDEPAEKESAKEEPPKGETPAAETPAPGSTPETSQTPPASETPPSLPSPASNQEQETYEQRWKTLQGIHKHDKEEWEKREAALRASIDELKKGASQVPAQPAATDTQKKPVPAEEPDLSDEMKEALEQYEADYDVISKMEGIKREREFKKLKDEMTAKISEILDQLAPTIKIAEETDLERHLNAIRSQHADFETYRDDGSILDWINSKPKYLQPAMKYAYEQGSVEDAVQLISDFKRENNIPASNETPNPNPNPAPEDTTSDSTNVVSINKRREEKRQAIASVDSRKGPVNPAFTVPDDFEGAFEEAVVKSK